MYSLPLHTSPVFLQNKRAHLKTMQQTCPLFMSPRSNTKAALTPSTLLSRDEKQGELLEEVSTHNHFHKLHPKKDPLIIALNSVSVPFCRQQLLSLKLCQGQWNVHDFPPCCVKKHRKKSHRLSPQSVSHSYTDYPFSKTYYFKRD